MAEDNAPDLGSVFEYQSDISSQEAPPPLPARTYIGTVTGAIAKMSQKGNTYADIEFTISPDQYPPDFKHSGEAVKLHYRRVTLTPDSDSVRYRIRKLCEALRVPVNRRFDLNDLMGKMGNLKVKNTTYQGEPRAEIEAVETV